MVTATNDELFYWKLFLKNFFVVAAAAVDPTPGPCAHSKTHVSNLWWPAAHMHSKITTNATGIFAYDVMMVSEVGQSYSIGEILKHSHHKGAGLPLSTNVREWLSLKLWSCSDQESQDVSSEDPAPPPGPPRSTDLQKVNCKDMHSGL